MNEVAVTLFLKYAAARIRWENINRATQLSKDEIAVWHDRHREMKAAEAEFLAIMDAPRQ